MMCAKKEYIEMFRSFTEPFNYQCYCQSHHYCHN